MMLRVQDDDKIDKIKVVEDLDKGSPGGMVVGEALLVAENSPSHRENREKRINKQLLQGSSSPLCDFETEGVSTYSSSSFFFFFFFFFFFLLCQWHVEVPRPGDQTHTQNPHQDTSRSLTSCAMWELQYPCILG